MTLIQRPEKAVITIIIDPGEPGEGVMRMQMKTIVLIPVLLLIMSLPVLANVELVPRIFVEEKYDDNIYLSDGDEEEDWITTVSPGLHLSYKQRSVDADIDYALRFQFYADHTEENDDNFKDAQRANGSLLFFSDRPFTLRISETISREAIDERNTLDPEETRNTNTSTVYRTLVSPEYRLDLSASWSLVFGYDYRLVKYAEPAGTDYQQHNGRFSVLKTLSSNTELSANYVYTVNKSDDAQDDYKRHNYSLGIVHQFGPRTRLSLDGGYAIIDYDYGETSNSTTAHAELSYRLTAPLTLFLSYVQDFYQTANDGLTKMHELRTGVNYEKDSLTSGLSLFWKTLNYERESRKDDIYGAEYTLGFALAKNLRANYNARYDYLMYNEEDENVNRFSTGLSFSYEYRRFVSTLGYRFRIQDSEADNDDYINNIVTLSASVKF